MIIPLGRLSISEITFDRLYSRSHDRILSNLFLKIYLDANKATLNFLSIQGCCVY
jgi:hypothetical protein